MPALSDEGRDETCEPVAKARRPGVQWDHEPMSEERAPRRIHIVGGPGSGKTTLARQVATAGALPVYDLDAVGYEGGAGPKRALDLRLADVRRIAAEPAWVTEGIFLWWTDELLRRADLIVWLDLPWRVAARRIIARHVRASLAGSNRHRGMLKLLSFLCSTRRYYAAPAGAPVAPDDDGAITRAATAQALAASANKLVHCRRPADVAACRRALL
jgi:hypothetical protein